MEEIGVRTGFIYGHYHYSNMLGPKLGSVPVIIPLAWFMMIYPSWRVAGVLARAINIDSLLGRSTQALIAAMVMTAWDMVMDPGYGSGAESILAFPARTISAGYSLPSLFIGQ